MLENLKSKNPEIEIFDVNSEEFSSFGRIIENLDIDKIVAVAKTIKNPNQGSNYQPGVEEFEKLSIAQKIKIDFFGEMDTQVGYCWGYNNLFNATEWHTSSEINIAVTDLLIIVGHLWDVKNNTIDTSSFKAFYVPAGTVLECYATTLHYGPCEVQKEGFGWVVALPKGTNTPLDNEYEDKLLWAKNKWLISHVDNSELVNNGAVAGVTGTNFEIKY